MATFDAQKTTWTVDDVLHFLRRLGFGMRPEEAATLAVSSVATTVAACLGFPVTDSGTFLEAKAYANPMERKKYDGTLIAPAASAFRLYRQFKDDSSIIDDAVANWAWRMQYNPNSFIEKLALFWHNFFATGHRKVGNPPFMTNQLDLFRQSGAERFPDLLVAVSKDPAMMVWLDTVENRVYSPTDVANENYAREVMELYSLGVDNGYNQLDISQLAKVFSGWTYSNENNLENKGLFKIDQYARAKGTVTIFGQTFSLDNGENIVKAIPQLRANQCAVFLARRLLIYFVEPEPSATVQNDFAAVILRNNFGIRDSLFALFKSAYFYDPSVKWSLIENPSAWIVRLAKTFCPNLSKAVAPRHANPTNGMPLFACWWALMGNDDSGNNSNFTSMGQNLLNPYGPNGWHEHTAWLNSETYRARTETIYGLCMGEKAFGNGTDSAGNNPPIFPTTLADWFPTAPTSLQAMWTRLVDLAQPAPIPNPIRDAILSRVWNGSFAWDGSASTESKVRETLFLLLTSPFAMQH